MQAVIRPTSGISDEQSRKTSPVQSRRWSSCVKAWLAAGNIARQKARLETILKFRTLNRSTRIVAPQNDATSARRFAALESIMIVLRGVPTLQVCRITMHQYSRLEAASPFFSSSGGTISAVGAAP